MIYYMELLSTIPYLLDRFFCSSFLFQLLYFEEESFMKFVILSLVQQIVEELIRLDLD